MENKNIGCEIIEDLMPLYADNICSEATKDAIESHIKDCIRCREKLQRMQNTDFKIEDMPEEDTEIISLTDKLKHEQRKGKRTNSILGFTSALLALCLIISLVPGGTGMVSEKKRKNQTVEIAKENSFIGVLGENTLGDYRAAKDYEEIYDYINNEIPNYDYMYDFRNAIPGGISKEESIAVDSAPTQVAGDVSVNDTNVSLYSSTNIMTEGVDESDISKTDGKYIYNVTSSEIVIFDIQSGQAEEISRLKVDFKEPSDAIEEIYVDGDKLSVITLHTGISFSTYNRYNSSTEVLIYDIKDRKKPVLSGRYSQDGEYHTSRKVGDIIYLFTNQYLEKPETNKKESVKNENIPTWFPSINDNIIAPGCIYLPDSGHNSIIISSFNQEEPDTVIDTKALIYDYADIYVGSESIYLYTGIYSGRNITKISKLGYKDGKITAGASTSVLGDINDDFAINEYRGNLRLVTTNRDNYTENILYVFDEKLNERGRINNIAVGEQLYSCRFMGDIGYFVTFKNTDPLFSVDLSDPDNPFIIGELKIPGFSEYLHFWDDNNLLGIGYETDGDGRRIGIKLSMFDISNPQDMKESGKHVISEADDCDGFYNYKSILCSPEGNLIGFSYWDYDRDKAAYVFYEYESGSFREIYKTEINSDMTEIARGHFRNDYLYISQANQVDSIKR